MRNNYLLRLLKKITKGFVVFVAIYLVLLSSDRLYGRIFCVSNLPDSIIVEQGDILFRTNSYTLAKKEKLKYGALPGHTAIALEDVKIAIDDKTMGALKVAEFGFLDRHKRTFQKSLSINFASNRFSYGKGRRFLLKTNLTSTEKKKLLANIEEYNGYPYSLWASKEDTSTFHCASFVWSVFKKSTGVDLDSDGGKYVFPVDISLHPKFNEPEKKIRF